MAKISAGRRAAKNVVRDVLHDRYCENPSEIYSDDCQQGCGDATQETAASLAKARVLVLHPVEESP